MSSGLELTLILVGGVFTPDDGEAVDSRQELNGDNTS